MEFERARNEEQKSIRREQIMEAALKLFETEPFEKITLASIANELSFSRANLYKYASSKEEIFLWILNSDLEKWVEQVSERLEKYDRLELKTFCRLCAELLHQNQRIMRLFPVLASVFESNVKPEELTAFKHKQNKSIERLKTISAKFLPDLANEQLNLFIRYQILYALNLYPQTVLYEKGSAGASLLNRKPDFITDFSDYLEIIIHGLRAQNL